MYELWSLTFSIGPNPNTFFPGSSMNAAFAIGRLLEREDARAKLLAMNNFKNTVREHSHIT